MPGPPSTPTAPPSWGRTTRARSPPPSPSGRGNFAPMNALLVLAAIEEHKPDQPAFYISAGVLVLFAIVMTIVGTTRAESFPATLGARRALCALAALLVAATMASAVLTG